MTLLFVKVFCVFTKVTYCNLKKNQIIFLSTVADTCQILFFSGISNAFGIQGGANISNAF